MSFEDGETVYVGHVHDIGISLDITLDNNNNIQQLNQHVVSTPLTRNNCKDMLLKLKSVIFNKLV